MSEDEYCAENPGKFGCPDSPSKGGCKGDRNTWDAGYGKCHTYAKHNNYWCDKDKDRKHRLFAEEVCSECGKCGAKMESSIGEKISMVQSNAQNTNLKNMKLYGLVFTLGFCASILVY